MKIEGKPTSINYPVEKVYEFLTDFNNFEQLMPEQITNWKSDNDSCSFTIQGMADISLEFGEKTPTNYVKLVPVGKVPFSFSLAVNLTDNGDNTKVNVSVEANLNPMMAMMAKRPLENLVNEMASNLSGAIG
jgi:carbon monoxide dehydrogenase subunit G